MNDFAARIRRFLEPLEGWETLTADAETAGVVAEVARGMGRDVNVRTHPWAPAGQVLALNRFAKIDLLSADETSPPEPSRP